MHPARAHAIMDAANVALSMDAELRALLEADGVPQDRLKTDLTQPLTRAYLDALRDSEDSHGS